MRIGDVVGDRFEIEAEVGAGGMGRVYRAGDRRAGGPVALKLLVRQGPADRARFEREAALLREVRHPGVVGYVAHGFLDDGAPWLAMEWIEGEPLSCRLGELRPTVAAALALASSVADALGAVHRAGLVHRDVKPSNLVLRGGDLGSPMLIDFGIARAQGAGGTVTRTGDVIGTPHYMAPEQARGEPADARADVYALGCVLFEMLAGRPAFTGPNELAVLTKVLLETPPSLRLLRADVPRVLSDLLERAMAKEAAVRPRDGGELAAALAALDLSPASTGSGVARAILGPAEQRVVSVLLCGAGARPDATAPTLDLAIETTLAERMRASVHRHGGAIDFLPTGAVVVSLTEEGAPTDRAVRAAHCALELRVLLPQVPMALATGRGLLGGPAPVGEVIDRGTALLEHPAACRAVAVDGVTAGLVAARFEVRGEGEVHVLVGERPSAASDRQLLGRASPFVGRDWELGSLVSLFEQCLEEGTARAVVVTAPAGAGKSRLATELVARLREIDGSVEVLSGRADALTAGAPFRVLADAVRGAAGLLEAEPIESGREKLLVRIGRSVAAADQKRVAELLGEMIGVPFPDSDRLRAARADARLLGDAMKEAFEDLLSAECARAPVVLVLDDLQWSGPGAVRFVDAALRNLRGRRLMVIALARPELDQAFPDLWAERDVQRIRLRPLAVKASRSLVEAMLGDTVDAATLDRIVDRAQGHAFFLEELIRAVAAGDVEALPDSVLAMVQARLGGLDAEERRVLRAASILGQAFWVGAVRALTEVGAALVPLLGALADRELVLRSAASAFAGEEEYAFRHALVREAAYAMLTDDDRRLGHRLAGEWLETAGSTDAAVLAEHFERGAAPERAVRWHLHAASQALAGYDFGAAVALSERVLRNHPAPDVRGRALLIQAEAHHVRGEDDRALVASREAAALLDPGSSAWFHAEHCAIAAAASRGEKAALAAAAQRASDARPLDPEARIAQALCLSEGAARLLLVGDHDHAERLLDHAREAAGSIDPDPQATAWIGWVVGHAALQRGDVASYLHGLGDALAGFERTGHRRYACTVRIGVGYACAELGEIGRAERELREALASAERIGLPHAVDAALSNLAYVLAQEGRHAEARDVAGQALARSAALADVRSEGASRAYLAMALGGLGRHDAAAAEAARAVETLRDVTPVLPLALAVLSRALCALGRAAEAVDRAREAVALLDETGAAEAGDALARLALAEALERSGDRPAAAAAIGAARDRIEKRAAAIEDGALRRSFLGGVPENARTLALAGEWAGSFQGV